MLYTSIFTAFVSVSCQFTCASRLESVTPRQGQQLLHLFERTVCFLPPSNFSFSHREQTQEVNARPGKKVSTGCEASRCVMSVCNLIANRKLITMLHKFHFYVIFFRTWFTKMTGITNPLHDILL